MKSKSVRATLLLLVILIAAFGFDFVVWTARGFPTQQIAVDVFSAMELKGQKEDYGTPETTVQSCQQRLLPTGRTPTCWWLTRHREVVRRF